MSNAPCYQCPNRHLKCHASCTGYQEWAEQHRAVVRANAIANIRDDWTYNHKKAYWRSLRKGYSGIGNLFEGR